MKRFKALLTFTLGAALALSAESTTHKVHVQDFADLTVVDGVNVEYHCDADRAGWAEFTCDDEIASHLIFTTNADKLTIQTDAIETPVEGVPTVKVYSVHLHRCENSGDSLLVVNLGEHADKFKVKQIGNGATIVNGLDVDNLDSSVATGRGSITLHGNAAKASISNVGSGPIDASDLAAEQIKCFLFGTGDVKCAPAETLKIFGAGSGSVFYKGTPEKVSNRSIGLKLQPILEASKQASTEYLTNN
ncbi:MAG: hypothetical protein HDS65_03885 [Bacteroidales bacterium]|nr:hypothetical protein [Bacteroidales bacterium]